MLMLLYHTAVAREASNFLNEVRPSMPSMSMGRARWSTEGGSIFSVADGRRLAQEPVRQPTPFEAMRQNRVAKATLETPLVAGIRCAMSTCHIIMWDPGLLIPSRYLRHFWELSVVSEQGSLRSLYQMYRRKSGMPV